MNKRLYLVSIGLDSSGDGNEDDVEMARMEREMIMMIMELWTGDCDSIHQIIDIDGDIVTFCFKNVTSISIDKDLGEV